MTTQNDCTCDTCSGACNYRPGWFMPGQAEKVAEHLGVSLQELFDTKLSVDWYVGNEPVFLLAPAIKGEDTGTEYPADPRGECIFFENGLCSIHPAKPFECREYYHDDNSEMTNKRHSNVAVSWDNKQLQSQIRELLGREPEEDELDIFDFFF